MKRWIFALALAALHVASTAQAGFFEYYIGRDLRAVNPGSGAPGSTNYGGLANPNFNRLTFLYAHTYEDTPQINHYHSKGVYSYTGPNLGANTAVVPFNAANSLPETRDPIFLLPGSGAFNGAYVSGQTPGVPFTDLRFGIVDSLASFAAGTPEAILFNSSAGRWNGLIGGANLSIVLVDATPGLNITDAAGNNLFSGGIGSSHSMGVVDSSFVFQPFFSAVARGNYTVRFKLTDSGTGNNGGPWLDSGEFVFRLRAVPEPSSVALMGLGGLGALALGYARRRRVVVA